jgi:hypothetical protein
MDHLDALENDRLTAIAKARDSLVETVIVLELRNGNWMHHRMTFRALHDGHFQSVRTRTDWAARFFDQAHNVYLEYHEFCLD